MKLAITVMALVCAFFTQAQNMQKSALSQEPESSRQENVVVPSAMIHRESAGSNYTYTFVSNRTMTEERATRWEARYLSVYPNLVSISIDPQTQNIELVLPSSHDEAELNEMISRFGYSGFQITN